MKKRQDNQLIKDRPLTFSPKLAKQVGVDGAIILQQVFYLCRQPNSGKILDDGEKYVYNTYEKWQSKYFPFWSVSTIKRTFLELEQKEMLFSRQLHSQDRTKHYRVNAELFEKINNILTVSF